jgi:hypothetical protein
MRDLDSDIIAALGEGRLKKRDFVWITARNRDTGEAESAGFWSDLGTVSAPVIDALTQSEVTRDFTGCGSALTIGTLSLTSDLTVRTLDVGLSQIDENIALVVRGYDVKLAPIQVYLGLFDPVKHKLIRAAFPVFVGFVDEAPIVTPKEGEFGSITLKCVSRLREMTRANPDVRSGASQKVRSAGDTFYDDTQNVPDWDIFWGQQKGKAA